jgi:hypothetical protein
MGKRSGVINMEYMIVKHKVKDYNRWKPAFDAHATTRKNGGSKGGRLFKSSDNPNELTIIWKWDSIENARKFASSPDLEKVMREAGVIGKPEIYFIEEVEKVPV